MRKISIPKNDYVQPTEVRENVVQSVCNLLLGYLDKPMSINIYPKSAELYVGVHKSTNEGIITRSTLNTGYSYTRIHSCEMDEAFKAFQDAGYHIYLERDKKTKASTYRFSKKPVLDAVVAKNLEFDVFID